MTVFITREITNGSYFYDALTNHKLEVNGQSFIEFNPIYISQLPQADWFFFYSKNGVRFFSQQFMPQLPILAQKVSFAAMGKGTEKQCIAEGMLPQYVGEGKPDLVAKSFIQKAKNKRVAFFRASNSKQSVQKLLKDQLNIIDIPIYENKIKRNIQLPSADILVFTSSMNVKAYFEAGGRINYQQKVVSIGIPTKKTLNLYGVDKIFLAKEPNEKSLVDEVLALLLGG